MERNKKKIESSIKAGITLIKEGNLRIRTLTSVWQDAIVKLYSNGELEWLYTSDMIHVSLMTPQKIGRLRVKPDESAVVAPEASYPGVFCVKHDHRVPRILGSVQTYFASADPLEAERWMHIINYTKLKHVTDLMKHSHPLTPCQAEDESGSTHPGEVRLAGPSIINSSKQTLECSYCGADICKYMPNTAKHCEFCQYNICRDCEQVLGSPQAKQLAYSSNHRQHSLVKLESIKDPSWYPTDFSSYICAMCKVPFDGPLYHCVECNDHDECPDCFREVTWDTPVQTSDNDMRDSSMQLDIGLLAHVIIKKGNDFELSKQRDRKPPQAASLTAHKCLDTPSAYFEVTIRQLDGQYVSVGIGGKSFAQNQLVGYQSNSFGYCNNGQVTVDCTLIGVLPAYGPGDTIGVGIVLDSFNVRRLYFTKNGQILGRFKVYEEFDYFPGVSFTPNTCQQLQFVVNFEGPFVFDLQRLIMDDNKTLTLIEKLPSEIIVRCLYFAADSLKQVAKFFQISKTFESLSGDNAIWKPLFLKKWPLQNSRLKLKSWMTLYKRRLETAKRVTKEMKIRTGSTGLSGVHYIENCGLEYECPIVIEDLFPYDIDGGAHYYCNTCNGTVYKAEDHDTLEQYIAMNSCVSLVQKHQSAGHNRLKMLTRFFGRNSVTINDPFDPTGLAPPQPPWK